MSVPSPPVSPNVNDERSTWEVRKLRAEVDALERPFRRPSVLLPFLTAFLVAVVAILGFVVQWTRSDREYKLTEIKTEQLKLDAGKLERRIWENEVKADEVKRQMLLLEKQRRCLDDQIALRNRDLARTESEIAQLQVRIADLPVGAADLTTISSRLRALVTDVRALSAPLPSAGISASPGVISHGETAQLRWSSTNITDLTISPGIGAVTSSGQRDVAPTFTTTYTVAGANPCGAEANASVTVIVRDRE